MIISFTTVFAFGASLLVAAAALAALSLGVALRALRRSQVAMADSASAAEQLVEVSAELARVAAELAVLRNAHDRAAATPARPGLRQAVALSRHGASMDELVATCRIGQSEARLIQMLYRSSPAAEPAVEEIH